MEQIWEERHRVASYCADFGWKARPSALFCMFSDEAGRHADRLGIGYRDMKKKAMAWLLAKMRVDMEKYPLYDQTVTIRTWTKGWDGPFAIRGYEMVDDNGERLCTGCSHWVVISTDDMKLLRPRDTGFDYADGRPDIVLPAPEKVTPEGTLIQVKEFTAGYSHIDFLHHVNNARYADWVCDCFNREFHEKHEMQALTLNYNRQVTWGEAVETRVYLVCEKPLTHRIEGVSRQAGNSSFFAEAVWRETRPG
ncbi:MAG: thioesterase [Bacillota bacterium]|nr:thioesterase [Bacillota bacterium]